MENLKNTDQRIKELEQKLEAANERKARRRSAGFMRAAAVMLIVTCLSVGLTSMILAKYKTGGAGDDGARTAAFEVDVVAATSNPEMTFDLTDTSSAQTYSYNFTLSNDSEVAVRYTAALTFNDADVAAMISSTEFYIGETKVADPAKELAAIAVGGDDVVVTVVFTVAASTETAAAVDYLSDAFKALTEPMSGWTGTITEKPFTITVTATQID